MMRVKIFLACYLLVIVFLFFYSFTQVDLSLTLSRLSIYQTVEKYFQHIGYFQRPLSSGIYIVILLLLFAFYFLFLNSARKNLISRKQFWGIIILTTIILTFSYNAFSYDLFNYIFDAKILTHYHQNPYLHKALDYQTDPMLSFMHWTHRVYPYGPTWLSLTVPLSFFGSNFFLPTFFLFKTLIGASFLGTAFFIEKIIKRVSAKDSIFGLLFFALNPLVIIESLVSSHNDIVMMFFALWGLYLFLNNKYFRGFLIFAASVGVKFATGFILPVFAVMFALHKFKKKIDWGKALIVILIFMSAAIVTASVRTNFQPWYLLYVLPFAAIISRKYFVFIPSIVLSLSSLILYIPFLYLGNWNPPVPTQLLWITTGGIAASVILTLAFKFKNLLE